MTNELLINRFLNHLRRDGKSVLTLSAYSTDLKQFLSLLPSPARLNASLRAFGGSPAGLKTIYQKWIERLTPNAAARKLTTLRSFLSWGYQGGYIKNDLAAAVYRPERKTISSAKPLSQSQIARLRGETTVQERLLLELLLQTGMRLPQILSLKMKHLDLRKFRIQNSEFRIFIPMSEYLRQSLDYYLAAVTRGPRSYLLVSPKTGRPPGVRAAGMMLSKLGRRARVKGVTPRNLRATFKINLH